jgi:hypothetical protein
MNPFEEDLRRALRREAPGADFSARVLARAGEAGPRRGRGWVAAAVAACVLAAAGGYGYREYEGRKAKRDLLIALDIAGSKLSVAQEKVFDLSRRTIHE